MTRNMLAVVLLLAGAAHAGPVLRDPFARPAVAVTAPPAETEPAAPPPIPQLRAVVLAGPRPLANIDGNVVTAGDTVAGWRVGHIAERSVALHRAGTHITISLKGSP